MMEDWTSDPEVRQWAEEFLEHTKPKLEESAVTMQLVPEDGIGDVKLWVELGASIMMGKPIIAVAIGDREVPQRLAEIADEIVYLDRGFEDEVDNQKLIDAIDRTLPDDEASRRS